MMLNWVVTLAYRVERKIKAVLRIHQRGVQAIAFTPDGKLVLVSLRYLGGWHLPGGGVKWRETTVAAVLREMREETAMESFAGLQSLGTFEEMSSGVPTTVEVFRIDGVRLKAPRKWNMEIREVRSWALKSLPSQCAVARKRLALLGI